MNLHNELRAARAFAHDGYRQFREAARQCEALADLLREHQREHDARSESGRCDCTLCRKTDAALEDIG